MSYEKPVHKNMSMKHATNDKLSRYIQIFSTHTDAIHIHAGKVRHRNDLLWAE